MPKWGWALVVEDEPMVAKALSRFVGRAGFSVRLASSAREGLRAVDEQRDLRLILADIELGRDGDGGLRILSRARATHPRACIAALSGLWCERMTLEREVDLLGAAFVKKGDLPSLERQIRIAKAYPIVSPRLAEHVTARSIAHRLTATQHAILCWLVAGWSPDSYCQQASIEVTSFAWHVKRLRAQFAGCPRVDALVAEILRSFVLEMERSESC